MASGKLTPRQKMINLMYLVLTALLALNVSKDILQSLQILADSLRQSAQKFDEKNRLTVEDIKATIQKEMEKGNKKNAYLIDLLDEIDKKTSEVHNELEKHIQELKKLAGIDPETGRMLKPDEVEKNFRYLMIVDPVTKKAGSEMDNGGRGNGAALRIHKMLDDYYNWAYEMYFRIKKKKPKKGEKVPFDPIVVEPKDNPLVPPNSEDKHKTWEIYTFGHNTPVAANVAVLENLKNRVEIIESELLHAVRSQLQTVTFKIDSLIAMDAPESKIVVVGLPFKTRLFVAMSSSEIKPRFTSGSGRIKVLKGGNQAELTVTARLPRGKSEGWQHYSATIYVPKADGTEARLVVKGKFKVRRPTIKVTSAAVQIMYRNCANDVFIDVPELGEHYDPVLSAKGGKVIVNKKNKKKVRVIPRGKRITIFVKSRVGGRALPIGQVSYRVIPPPKPDIVVGVGKISNRWDGQKPWKKGDRICIKIMPEKNFGRTMPKDARYRIEGIVVKVKKGLGAPQPVKSLGRSKVMDLYKGVQCISLFTITRGLPPGTKIYLQLKRVVRINFEGRAIEEPFSKRELTISGVVE